MNSSFQVRCPEPACATVFTVEPERLGRNHHCPQCGIGLTARPLSIEGQLRDQQEKIQGLESSPLPRLPLAVLVDNVRSLWNVGSIFRTADACGVERLVLAGITGAPPRPEITKTALGAEEVVAWRYRADGPGALAELKREGHVAVAIETSPRAIALDRFEWPHRPCIVIGNEVAGIAPPLLAACPHHVFIPMRGLKDSLNVAVAFGIAACAAALAIDKAAARGPSSGLAGPPERNTATDR